MWLATLQFERKLHKCIGMGITIFKNFHFGRDNAGVSGAIKRDFQPYIRQYTSQGHTSQNEHFLILLNPKSMHGNCALPYLAL